MPPRAFTTDREISRPTAAYLRPLVRGLVLMERVPDAIRDECDHLLLAINANDLTRITDSLSRLKQLAEVHGLQLPPVGPE